MSKSAIGLSALAALRLCAFALKSSRMSDEAPKLRRATPKSVERLARRAECDRRTLNQQREADLEQSRGPFRVGSVNALNTMPLTRGVEDQVIYATGILDGKGIIGRGVAAEGRVPLRPSQDAAGDGGNVLIAHFPRRSGFFPPDCVWHGARRKRGGEQTLPGDAARLAAEVKCRGQNE